MNNVRKLKHLLAVAICAIPISSFASEDLQNKYKKLEICDSTGIITDELINAARDNLGYSGIDAADKLVVFVKSDPPEYNSCIESLGITEIMHTEYLSTTLEPTLVLGQEVEAFSNRRYFRSEGDLILYSYVRDISDYNISNIIADGAILGEGKPSCLRSDKCMKAAIALIKEEMNK